MSDASGAQAESAKVWKPLAAIRERIGAVLVGLLIFSILLATAGFVASYDARREMSAFAADGRTVIGTVTDAPRVSSDQLSRIALCFRMQDGGYHCGTTGVPTGIYNNVRVGSPLKVTYVPSHPDWFYVGDNAPDDRDSDIFARMFQYCTITGLLLIIAIAVMVFWQHGDGTAEQAAGTSQPNDVASRFRQRHGARRRR